MRLSVAKVTLAVAIIAIAASPALSASDGSFFERHVQRCLASPAPQGAPLDDGASFAVTVPRGVVVQVTARAASPGTLFELRAGGSAVAVPSSAASALLQGPRQGDDASSNFTVVVDPVAGEQLDINVTFAGFVSDVGGSPASFTLGAWNDPQPLGACLP